MSKILKVFFFLLALIPFTSFADEVTVKIYPYDDGVNFLYDDDAQVIWDSARNFDGEIIRDAQESASDGIGDFIRVRSDRGVGTYRIYRASTVFDTSVIPDNAEILSATLNIYPIGVSGDVSMVVTSHERASTEVLQKTDWPITTYGTTEFARSNLAGAGYNELPFTTAGLGLLTQLALQR